MALDTTDRAASLIRAKERSDNGTTAENDAYIGDLLDASSAPDPNGVMHFRPYLVAALVLDTTTMRVEGAPEAEFRSVDKNIAALRAMQAAEDDRLNLTIPEGWLADDASVDAGRVSMALRNTAHF